jgi:hypothetical protein
MKLLTPPNPVALINTTHSDLPYRSVRMIVEVASCIIFCTCVTSVDSLVDDSSRHP